MKREAFVIYLVYDVLLDFQWSFNKAYFKWRNAHILVGFLSAEFEEGDSDVEEIEKVECRETKGMVYTLELLAIEDCIAPIKSLGDRDENT